jgi:hypothetical protein
VPSRLTAAASGLRFDASAPGGRIIRTTPLGPRPRTASTATTIASPDRSASCACSDSGELSNTRLRTTGSVSTVDGCGDVPGEFNGRSWELCGFGHAVSSVVIGIHKAVICIQGRDSAAVCDITRASPSGGQAISGKDALAAERVKRVVVAGHDDADQRRDRAGDERQQSTRYVSERYRMAILSCRADDETASTTRPHRGRRAGVPLGRTRTA